MAILTSHTCHVAILPAASHLRSGDLSPLRLKTFQLGPTAHVLEQAPLVAAIWHPLSPYAHCLVTVTRDSCVRLWELEKDNRSTFDEPALAVDLKKLVNASSTQADLSASKYGASKGFSPENETMIAASASFGGKGRDEEHGWASMTLWVAMTEGDVYALCPFLPSQWRAPATTLPSLTTSVVAKTRALNGGEVVSESERIVCDQQCKWLADVDGQEPLLIPGDGDFDMVEVYTRPARSGPIPKLQGPFYLEGGLDAGEITDIHIIAPKVDDDALYGEEYEDDEAEEGLSVGVVCLTTSTGKVHICLDLNGVEAAWLPSKRSRALVLDDGAEDQELLLFETIDLAVSGAEQEAWPTFTPSPSDRYEVFATQAAGVYSLSFRPWMSMLEDELASASEAGIDFRLGVLLESAQTDVSNPIELPIEDESDFSAAIAVTDSSVGFIVLTSTNNVPYSAILDTPTQAHPYAPDTIESTALLAAPEPRAPYHPDEAFYQQSQLPRLMKAATDRKLVGNDLKAQIRFSPATLKLMEDAHRVLGDETLRLGMAAADLFRKCERMQAELKEQVRRINEIADKVDNVVGGVDEDAENDEDEDDEPLSAKHKIDDRLVQSEQRRAGLNDRVEALRRKMLMLGSKQLSAKETAFADEVEKLQRSVLAGQQTTDADAEPPEAPTDPVALLHMDNSPSARKQRQAQHDEDHGQPDEGSLAHRFDAVQGLLDQLTPQVEEAAGRIEATQKSMSASVSSDYRRRKLAQVFAMLERETALVDAVTERLSRLKAGG